MAIHGIIRSFSRYAHLILLAYLLHKIHNNINESKYCPNTPHETAYTTTRNLYDPCKRMNATHGYYGTALKPYEFRTPNITRHHSENGKIMILIGRDHMWILLILCLRYIPIQKYQSRLTKCVYTACGRFQKS